MEDGPVSVARRQLREVTSIAHLSAPSRTRTDTVRILSPLPLPIGLWGPRMIVETSIAVANLSS